MAKYVNYNVEKCQSVARQFVAAYDAHHAALEKFRLLYVDHLMEAVKDAREGPLSVNLDLCKMIPCLSQSAAYSLVDLKFLGRIPDMYD